MSHEDVEDMMNNQNHNHKKHNKIEASLDAYIFIKKK